MFWLRLTLLIACLGLSVRHLDLEQRSGRLQKVDDLFLDFLVANSRERLTQPATSKASPVTLVSLREEQAKEYATWPPPPLDWQTLLKSLQAYAPEVMVIATPLYWGRPAPEFLPSVSEALLPFPSVVLGIETQLAEHGSKTPAFMGDLADKLPHFQRVDGPQESVQPLSALISAPDPALRPTRELGLLAARKNADSWSVPYALRADDRLYPGIIAQTLARLHVSPYSLHRLRIGPGAGAYLAQGSFVPLEEDGTLPVSPGTQVPVVNALDLMTGTLADALGDADKAALKSSQVIVIGVEPADKNSPDLGRLHAQALAQTLLLPKLQKLTEPQQWATWAICGLAAAWIVLRVPRSQAFSRGLGLIFAALVLSFLAFQIQLLWCPPTLPVAILGIGTLLGLLMGRGKPAPAAPAEPPVPAQEPPAA
jgi:hypothetical protein